MRRTYLEHSSFAFFIILICLNIFSCSSTKKVKYFQDIPDSGQLKTIGKADFVPLTIQTDDILTVIIQTIDPETTTAINMGNVLSTSTGAIVNPSSSMANANMPVTAGYLVDKDGLITIPILGAIKVTGYTTSEAAIAIKNIAIKYFKEPTVIVRFANFKVSVTGEVLKPGMYSIPNEKISILDALALAGDLTIYGKRENVLLLRENPDGTKTPYRFNLKKSNLMTSPVFYLRQNDIIYVEPGSGKAAATDASQARYYTLVGSLLSVLIVLFTRK